MANDDRGRVIRVPMHERDWSLFLGTLQSLANGVEQAGDPDLRAAVKAALVRRGHIAHVMKEALGRGPLPARDCETCHSSGNCATCGGLGRHRG